MNPCINTWKVSSNLSLFSAGSPPHMAKFKLQPDERILKKGGIIYYPPETKNMGALKAGFKAKQGKAFLTSARIVGATKVAVFPFGPLIWLIMWMIGRKILFEIALNDITSVKKSSETQQFFIYSKDNCECIIAFDSILDSRGKWLTAIADAISAGEPGAKVETSEETVEVTRT